ncbi:MAG: asparagine synthase (glutamine-hydrolyzing) [Oscillochloridaceae bacterium]|nr:asparagine synthase (glutamine-hydrolyzing) [Chloroflexaceae bacterium]MDW8388723.1 asparagine synthase (glutamine-hydrolyzing) [Oscillochloridaceae bacterium]
MCGIAGLLFTGLWSESLLARLQAMTDAQRHRGPDDQGVELLRAADPAVGFGHRRLAIIDLSPAGHQPMADPDRNTWITFNGEIYNFRALRRELEALGQRFRSQSDTEVILKAYAAWGPDAVARLRGIFAFAIWDEREQTLLLARDQLGVKPLYVWQGQGLLLFASEVRALLASGLVPRRLDAAGLQSYLAYGAVQEPFTLVESVRSLPPGHMALWRAGALTTRRYWQLPAPDQVLPLAPPDVYAQIAQQLREAVGLQLVADVPLGAFLSGGIDSTAIAALMRQSGGASVRTFSVIFDEKEYDERAYARIAARHIGAEHHELLLRGDEVRRALPEVLAAFDQPSIDGVNTYFVSKVTREAGLTVALSGLGGDELFGGYEGYRKPLLLERWGAPKRWLPPAVRRGTATLMERAPGSPMVQRAGAFLRAERHPYFASRQIFTERQIAALVAPELLDRAAGWEERCFGELEVETRAYDPINRASALEMRTYMLSMLLRDADQMSMAHALELRVPLIDHVLVERVFALPGALKVDPAQPKPLLTRALDGALPLACVNRPKHGFTLPFAVWLRESLRAEMRAVLCDDASRGSGPFRGEGLANLWQSFERGQIGWSRVWGIYVLHDWLQRQNIVA